MYWRVAQRARKLLGEGREKLFTEADIDAIEQWVGKTPTTSGKKSWMEINKEFNEFNDSILNLAEESGLISKQFREYMAKDGFYVPFYRVLQDAESRAEFTKSPFHNKQWISAQIKKLRGSEKKIGDPMSNMIKNWAHLLAESVHNKARSQAFEQAIALNLVGEDGVPLVEEVSAGDTYRWVPGKKQEDGIKVMFAYKKTGEPLLTFMKNGKPVYFRVNDPEVFNALSMLDVKYFDENILKVFSGAKRMLTFGATIGPAFRIANFIRDTLHTFVISKSFKPFWDSMQGFAKVYARHPDYIKYIASGHAFAGSYIREGDRKAQQKYVDRVIKKEGKSAAKRILDTPKKLWDLWIDLGEASENAARVQIYSNMLKQGHTHLEASFSARDVMDFNMRGNGAVLQALISTVPFLNARIQGLYRMGRAAKSDPRGFLLKGGLITMASLLLWYLNKDDERYKELEDFEKFQYYHFWIGDKHYRIPKPFETGVIFSTLFEASADVMSGNEEFDHIIDALGHAFMETFSFNPTPQVAKPVLEQVMNKNFFSWRPIETQTDLRKRRGDRYSPWSSETLRLLGDKLNVSPKRMEAMLRGYLSSFGMGLLMITDAVVDAVDIYPERPTGEIGDLPGIGRFVKEASPARYTKYQTAFYDTVNEINEIHGTIQHYSAIKDFERARELATDKRELLALRTAMNRHRAQISKINNNIKMIWRSTDMSPDEKRKGINEWVTRKNEILKNVYNQLIKKEK
jgi:hypothetical protein